MPALALIPVGLWLLMRPPEPGLLAVAGMALLTAFGLTPFVRLIALRAGAVDHPDARKRHASPTPKLGGVAVIAAVVLVMGQRPLLDRQILSVAVCALVLMLAGVVDDSRGLSATLRLLLQVACAAIVIESGVRMHLVPGPAGTAANVVLSILWIVGITNAYNFIDGIDGLAASLGALIAFLLTLSARGAAQPVLAGVCAILAGALLGFLPYNLRRGKPASVFLGDSGSASVGFLLAALAIKQDWAGGDPLIALAAPVLIFSVLIYDMIRTTATRIASGRVRSFREWIDYVGRDHIHHRFSDLLGGSRPALVLILALALGLGLSALGLRRGSPGDALIFLIHGALILLVVAVLEEAAIRRRPRRAGRARRG